MNPDLVSSAHAHYRDPRKVSQNAKSTASPGRPQPGTSHRGNSHAHLGLAKRRHDIRLEGADEADFRSIHPPATSPWVNRHPHFYASPEPHHMAANLYPEGPSVTARHMPEHFVCNVVYDSEMEKPSQYGNRRDSDSNASGRTPSSSRMSGFHVYDGTRPTPVPNLFCAAAVRSPRSTVSPSVSTAFSPWVRDGPRSPDSFDFNKDPGHPPPFRQRSNEAGHVYKSHAQMQYDKSLCQASAYRHTDKWERIEAGSQGHSQGGSDFGSGFGGYASQGYAGIDKRASQPSKRASQEARTSQMQRQEPERREPSREKRSRSTDAVQKQRRQSPRAASFDRVPRRRNGSQTPRRSENRRRNA